MIKEDHLLACTTRMIEIQIALPSLRLSREREPRESNDLDRLDNHCCTQQFLGTHPRGLSDYSLVKELVTAIVVNNFRHSHRSFFRVPQTGVRLGEANSIVRFQPVNRSFRFSFRLVFVWLRHRIDGTKTTNTRRQNLRPEGLSLLVTITSGRAGRTIFQLHGLRAGQQATEAF
jgi:hypothetical protein